MVEISLKELIRKLPDAFIPDNAKNKNAQIQVSALGNNGGEWGILIKNQECKIEDGSLQNPDFTISANSEDIMKIFSGDLDPLRAYMQGKVQFKGRIKQAMDLMDLFSVEKIKSEIISNKD